jgi:hypothetical protein
MRAMNAFPTRDWFVRYVHRDDAERPNPRRPARALLVRDGFDGLLLPVSGDRLTLVGYVLPDFDTEEWVECTPPVIWEAGRVPIVSSFPPLRITFVDPAEAQRRRRVEAAHAIVAALDESTTEDAFDRVARLEHADRILGGSSAAVAGLLALRDKFGEEARAGGDPDSLLNRIRERAPSGLGGVSHELSRLGFEYLREPSVRGSLLRAADQAFSDPKALNPREWAAAAERTLWAWWIHWRALVDNSSIPELARRLGVDPLDLATASSGTKPPSTQVLEKLPEAREVRRELEHAYRSPLTEATAAALRPATLPRLELMSAQLSELERRVNVLTRLTHWESLRPELQSIASWTSDLIDEAPWNRARLAAHKVRDVLELPPDDPLDLSSLVRSSSAALVGAALPSIHLLGSWASGNGGAPVVALTPSLLSGDLGVTRFAVAHQVGHIVGSAATDEVEPCSEMLEAVTRDPAEAFANAFAAYLLAPRAAIQRHVGHPSEVTDAWLLQASRDAAVSFGLSARTAVHHVLNCIGASERAAERVAALADQHQWLLYRAAVRDAVEDEWSRDRRLLHDEIGAAPPDEPEAVFGRPRSAVFDRLLGEAVSQGVMEAEQARQFSTDAT